VTAHAYTEDQLVEQPGIGLFAALGWQSVRRLRKMCPDWAGTKMSIPLDVYVHTWAAKRKV
jgi:hypothetical protein